MPVLQIQDDSRSRILPAVGSVLAGRQWTCIARFSSARIPLYWLEIRWLGERWAWRALAPNDQTRGSGTTIGEGWRQLVAGSRLRWDDAVWLQLTGDGPPETTLWDEASGDFRTGEALDSLLEIREGRVLPLLEWTGETS